MSSNMTVGSRLRSQVDSTEVLVVRPTSGTLECGGLPMLPLAQGGEQVEAVTTGAGAAIGKRYTSAAAEVLVTKAGDHPLAVDGVAMSVKASKQLPSSD